MKNFILTIGFVFFTTFLFAQSEIYSLSGEAIEGFDPVAYFKNSKPVKGNKAHTYQWKDATWYFSSAENLNAFKLNPEKYAPQYGGYCAYGVAEGYKAAITPEAWTILNGKLYLNYNQEVQTLWNKDQSGYIKKADENWSKVKSTKKVYPKKS